MEKLPSQFRKDVEALVAQIPRGRVMTYGQLAALCGNARAARIVGGIAHFGDPDLPWQRVVHKQVLEAEGVAVSEDFKIDVQELIWWPNE
jgi:methylated-DNA-protein-cysteine methyltransferase-like protein